MNIARADCDGTFDPNVHQPWSLVRTYLEAVAGHQSVPLETFSTAFRSSEAFSRYEQQMGSIDLTDFNH